ncbi:MAG: hypothetical protein ACWA5K_02640 [bacterium]
MFDIVFRGDLTGGKSIVEVKAALQKQFKLEEAAVDRLFSGRPVVLKKGLSESDANRFKDVLNQLGADVQLRVAEQSSETAAATDKPPATSSAPAAGNAPANPSVSAENPTEESSGPGWSLGPVGGDMLSEDERTAQPDVDVDTSALSLAPGGVDVLADEDKKPFVSADVDTSHLDLSDDEAP